jgi:hypothetical protein
VCWSDDLVGREGWCWSDGLVWEGRLVLEQWFSKWNLEEVIWELLGIA